MSSKINLGIIGSGFIVKNFIEASKLIDDINLHAFYSRNIDTATKFKNEYNFTKTYTNLDDMANDKELDAIYIASPNSIHHLQAIKFLKNKKHVLCEKAFASNSNEVEDMIKTAKENNVLLMEAMRLTVLPNFLQVKNNLHKIGKIRRYFASYCQYSSRYDKYKEGIILNAFKNELSNGSLMDIGVYCIAPMVNLFGVPKNILCNALMLESGVDAQGSAIFKYDDMDGVIMFSKISNSHLPSEIQGENGSIIIEKINNFSSVKIVYTDGSTEDLTLSQYENDMYYEISHFIDLIKSNKTYSNLNTLENSLSVMNIMDTIRKQIGLYYPADMNN
ncbi:Gfo/Idh/MocA family oxidoreductase [Romboutsia sp.]|uniref:Gfo/Idh/MocA family protein n=1 Tax=Romboutsia sp. TaxID=1965302 RepID=UPI002BDA4DDB|nr:Gfo/Idh/MocA family oxidoreductase [Romboutsia sp.]HSQ89547.1 Gfo/Idh/MocA family oxidoreductase [Romboutsia sp.]